MIERIQSLFSAVPPERLPRWVDWYLNGIGLMGFGSAVMLYSILLEACDVYAVAWKRCHIDYRVGLFIIVAGGFVVMRGNAFVPRSEGAGAGVDVAGAREDEVETG